MIDNLSLLKEYDLKVTPQRVAIIEELCIHGHMNIDDLYKKLSSKFPSISLATIYKNINTMCEKLFLSEVKIPNNKSVFELTKSEHTHLVCKSCGYIEDIVLDASSLLDNLSRKSSFKVDSSDIIFSGICNKCQK
ncbi:MAG: transcriptional repressor [Arcobacter sp.]|nr:MAG: transcriptional repressor [Arcobacter sp.]